MTEDHRAAAAEVREPVGPPGPAGAGPTVVTAEWLAAHLSDADLVLLEVDADAVSHHLAHVPGATFVDWHDSVRGLLAPGEAGRAAFEELMSSRGVQPDDEVVVYGDAGNRYAAAVFWLMRYHGHRRLRLLDGGRADWAAGGGTLTDAETRRRPTHYRAGAARPGLRAGRDDVLEIAAASGRATLLDCRSPEEYAGRGVRVPDHPGLGGSTPGTATGHVPGARNLPVACLVDDHGRLRARDELVRVAADAGVSADRPVVVYCHRCERSSLVWFVLVEVLGHPDVRVYDGGWQEYGNLPDAVVERPRNA